MSEVVFRTQEELASLVRQAAINAGYMDAGGTLLIRELKKLLNNLPVAVPPMDLRVGESPAATGD